MLSYERKTSGKELVITFNQDLISTTVDQAKDELIDIFQKHGLWNESWESLTLDMRALKMIDSLGLNYLISICKRVQKRPSAIRTYITSRTIYQTLLATRMDKQMTIKMEEDED